MARVRHARMSPCSLPSTRMAHVEIVDQTLRDGAQSLWGMRIRASGMVTGAAPDLDRAGYQTIELPSGSFFSVLLRYLREDPIEAYTHIRSCFPNTPVRGGSRPSSTGRSRHLAPLDPRLHHALHGPAAGHRRVLDLRLPLQHAGDGAPRPCGARCRRPADSGRSCTGSARCTPTSGSPTRVREIGELGYRRRRSTSRTRPAILTPGARAHADTRRSWRPLGDVPRRVPLPQHHGTRAGELPDRASRRASKTLHTVHPVRWPTGRRCPPPS